MRQIALPLTTGTRGRAPRIVLGNANSHVAEALAAPGNWPFRTAILFGPSRAGKSLLAAWFAEAGHASHHGVAIDDADAMDEAELFHRWNRAQQSGHPLLLVCNRESGDWPVSLPDLASRLAAALHLTIGAPDDAMLASLIAVHAEMRGLVLDASATEYLVPRCERSHVGVEKLIATIDRLSLERKAAPTLGLWRDAIEELGGASQPRLL